MKKSLKIQDGNSIQHSEQAAVQPSAMFHVNKYSEEELKTLFVMSLNILQKLSFECTSDALTLSLYPLQDQIEKIQDSKKKEELRRYFEKFILFMDAAKKRNPLNEFLG